MYVKFKTLRFKNFLTYGNGWTTINFNTKLNIITAPNGSGKSSIVDAISFALFGRPYREIPIKGLVNYINKRHMEVEIEYQIGEDEYKLCRGILPNKFELIKNGEAMDILSSKKLNQIELDKLLGVKYLLFKNVMCIGAISNVPFFNMSLPDRRELMETIFGLGNLADMLGEVKNRNSNNKIEFKTNSATLLGLNTSISDTISFINDMKEKSKKFEDNQAARIAKIQEHIEQQKTELGKKVENIKKCEVKCDELAPKFEKIEETKQRLLSRNEAMAVQNARIADLREKLSNRDKPVCPICGTDMCSEHAKAYFDGLQNELDTELGSQEHTVTMQNADKEQFKSESSAQTFYNQVQAKIAQEKMAIANLESAIEYDEKQIEDIKSEKNDFDWSAQESKLSDYEGQKRIVNTKLSELEEQMAVDADLQVILSDSGIKKYFFTEIVPIMNTKINEYIRRFGLDVEVLFDDMMEYQIHRGNFEMQYNNLSNGEKTRVNVAMLLTFYDIAKQLSNWSCSILFMDEIFDTGIDSDGITAFIQELIEMLQNDNELGVYLISHKLNDLNFSQIQYKFETLKVQKSGLFSKIIQKDEE